MKKMMVVLMTAALVVLMLPAVTLAAGADEWSQYQKDQRHGGVMDLQMPATNAVNSRTADIKARDCSQPVVAGESMFVYAGEAGTSGAVYCFNLKTGAQAWKTDITAVSAFESWSSPAVSGGGVYIGSGTKVHALDAVTGAALWTKDLETVRAGAQIVNSSIAVDGNRLFVGDFGNGNLYCLDAANAGNALWAFAVDADCLISSTPCVDSGRVYIGQGAKFGAPVSPNGKVWCIDEATGLPVASFGTNGAYATVDKLDMTGTVTAYGDFIYFTDFTYGAATTPNCHLYCLNKTTGAERWKTAAYSSDGAPAVTDGFVAIAGQQSGAWPAPGTNWTTAFSADTDTGVNPAQLWTKSGVGGSYTSVCIAGDRVAVGTETTAWPITGTDVYCLEAATGNEVWHSTEGGGSPVLTSYGLLSIGDGKVVTFGGGGVPAGDYYFAEGTTRPGYQEWLCLSNPTAAPISAHIDYMASDGAARAQDIALPPTSRTTVDVNLALGPGLDVAARVTGNGHFIAERAMYIKDAAGRSCGEQVMGVTGPTERLLYAEGTTRAGFQTWLALQNPGDDDANVIVTYLFGDGTQPIQENRRLKAKGRETVDVNLGAGAGRDVSVAVTASRPVVGERVMYFQYPGQISGTSPVGVHNSTGAGCGQTAWHFAEGTTRHNFDEWLCLMNPSSTATVASIEYLGAGGTLKTQTVDVPANARVTVDVKKEVGPDQDVGMLVTCPRPVVAERPMYFEYVPVDGTGKWGGGHTSLGASYSAYRWEFAEGCTRPGYQTFLCISNPNGAAVEADIAYFIQTAGGAAEASTEKVTVAARSRKTVFVNQSIGLDRDVSATVTCSSPIVVERPEYFSSGEYQGGGDSLGLPGAL